jgi:hypothetical protein
MSPNIQTELARRATDPLPAPSIPLTQGVVIGTPEQTRFPKALPAEGQGGMNPTIKNFLLRMGVPLAATIAGSVSDSFLPAAAGLTTGYNQGFARQEDSGFEKAKELYKGIEKLDEEEKEKRKESYNMALALSKTGPLGGIEPTTPQKIKSLADEIYKVRYPEAPTKSKAQETLENVRSFSSEAEAKSDAKPGEVVIINGRRARIKPNKE